MEESRGSRKFNNSKSMKIVQSNVTDQEILSTMCQNSQLDSITTDNHIPSYVPSEKVKYKKNWHVKVTNSLKKFNLNHTAFKDLFDYQSYNRNNLAEVEIHVVWIPHVPIESSNGITTSLSCLFTATTDEERELLSKTIFPVSFAMHSIFKPGHSVTIGPKSKIPWAIGVQISDEAFENDYVISEMYISLIGFKTPIGTIDGGRGSNLISLMPLDEISAGISIDRPRVFGNEWIVNSYKKGIKNSLNAKKIMRLQEVGIDVEGIISTGMLSKVLKIINLSDLSDPKSEKFRKNLLEAKSAISKS